jgi:hypothetical protein
LTRLVGAKGFEETFAFHLQSTAKEKRPSGSWKFFEEIIPLVGVRRARVGDQVQAQSWPIQVHCIQPVMRPGERNLTHAMHCVYWGSMCITWARYFCNKYSNFQRWTVIEACHLSSGNSSINFSLPATGNVSEFVTRTLFVVVSGSPKTHLRFYKLNHWSHTCVLVFLHYNNFVSCTVGYLNLMTFAYFNVDVFRLQTCIFFSLHVILYRHWFS